MMHVLILSKFLFIFYINKNLSKTHKKQNQNMKGRKHNYARSKGNCKNI